MDDVVRPCKKKLCLPKSGFDPEASRLFLAVLIMSLTLSQLSYLG